MPFTRLCVVCRPFSPMEFHDLPALTIRGALGYALGRVACKTAQQGGPQCPADRTGRPRSCRVPDGCAWPLLLKPHSARQKTDLPSPLVLSCSNLAGRVFHGPFEVRMALVGGRALAAAPEVAAALKDAGLEGLDAGAGRVPFFVESVDVGPATTFREHAGAGPMSQTALVEFTSPFLQDDDAPVEPSFDFVKAAGNFSAELMRMSLEDSCTDLGPDKRAYDDAAEEYKSAVMAHGASVVIGRSAPLPFKFGERTSRQTGSRFHLNGWGGYVVLSSIPPEIWPLLKAMEVFHFGQHKPQGFGEVRIWM